MWGFPNLPDDGFKQLAAKRTDLGDPLGDAFFIDNAPHRTAIQATTTGMLVAVKTSPDDDSSWVSNFLLFE